MCEDGHGAHLNARTSPDPAHRVNAFVSADSPVHADVAETRELTSQQLLGDHVQHIGVLSEYQRLGVRSCAGWSVCMQ